MTAGDGPTASDALVVIDAQAVFADPSSPWGSPMFAEAWPHIERRVSAYGEEVIVTRFVAPERPAGAWVPYYEEWPFALQPPDSELYQLVPGLRGRASVDETTFGKWGPALRSALGDAASVELVGVATDCCVISTALAMADAGVAVTVPAEACAGSTPENHSKALDVMALYSPLITVRR
ncbi:cysteine hydrolase [Luteipulveratus sp. YIM 133132]|uniref:cysteine hydrolase family protein n=1 Tax=Luteipulveratus flavus TaxID=3031728 RepID=UPI0023B1926A|nr:cysteine hydrolase [Luteipulveratus sp. YIM 133132]MDE9366859.1 cysteine hydrolase [Luteipulveratus sp. YIM 133132]